MQPPRASAIAAAAATAHRSPRDKLDPDVRQDGKASNVLISIHERRAGVSGIGGIRGAVAKLDVSMIGDVLDVEEQADAAPRSLPQAIDAQIELPERGQPHEH